VSLHQSPLNGFEPPCDKVLKSDPFDPTVEKGGRKSSLLKRSVKSKSGRGSKGVSLNMIDMEGKKTKVKTPFNIFVGLISFSIDPC
jgi:hypothetical protein